MMAAAGLTHRGFYRHFRNKEHLVSQALYAAGEKTIATISRKMAKGGLNAAVDGYLSKSHRDFPTPICPFAALGSEMARSREGDEGRGDGGSRKGPRHPRRATRRPRGSARQRDRRPSTMIGAMTLARVVADSDLSSGILNRAKDHLRR